MNNSLRGFINKVFCNHDGANFIGIDYGKDGTVFGIYSCGACGSLYRRKLAKDVYRAFVITKGYNDVISVIGDSYVAGTVKKFSLDEALMALKSGSLIIDKGYACMLMESLSTCVSSYADVSKKNRILNVEKSLDKQIIQSLNSVIDSKDIVFDNSLGLELSDKVSRINFLTVWYSILVRDGSVVVPKEYFSIFRKLLFLLYGFEKARNTYEWKIMDGGLYNKFSKRTKSRK